MHNQNQFFIKHLLYIECYKTKKKTKSIDTNLPPFNPYHSQSTKINKLENVRINKFPFSNQQPVVKVTAQGQPT